MVKTLERAFAEVATLPEAAQEEIGRQLLAHLEKLRALRSAQLVLLGGHTGAEVEGHDWERILQLTGLLHRDHQIAWTAHVIGALLMLGGIIWAIVVTWQARQEDNQRGH